MHVLMQALPTVRCLTQLLLSCAYSLNMQVVLCQVGAVVPLTDTQPSITVMLSATELMMLRCVSVSGNLCSDFYT